MAKEKVKIDNSFVTLVMQLPNTSAIGKRNC